MSQLVFVLYQYNWLSDHNRYYTNNIWTTTQTLFKGSFLKAIKNIVTTSVDDKLGHIYIVIGRRKNAHKHTNTPIPGIINA